MPPLRELANPSMNDWVRLQTPFTSTTNAPTQSEINTQGQPMRSPYMHASMPPQASTADVFVRQLYGGPNVPTYRVLPAGKASGG